MRKLRQLAGNESRLIFDLNFLSGRFAQRAQVSVHRARMTKNKTRHEPEHRVVDLAVFHYPDDGHFADRLKRVSP
jgi:hypothetical protein